MRRADRVDLASWDRQSTRRRRALMPLVARNLLGYQLVAIDADAHDDD
jgi:hypothetical protein